MRLYVIDEAAMSVDESRNEGLDARRIWTRKQKDPAGFHFKNSNYRNEDPRVLHRIYEREQRLYGLNSARTRDLITEPRFHRFHN